MAFDAFLKIDGIPGESTDESHRLWIEVIGYSHAVSQPAAGVRSAGSEQTAERCHHQDFIVRKLLDKASPKLSLCCCRGTHIKEVKMELCRATGDKQKYMEYKLSDVIVSSVRPAGDPGGREALPVEEVAFNYGKIEWTYTETDHDTGKTRGDIRANWDLIANRGN